MTIIQRNASKSFNLVTIICAISKDHSNIRSERKKSRAHTLTHTHTEITAYGQIDEEHMQNKDGTRKSPTYLFLFSNKVKSCLSYYILFFLLIQLHFLLLFGQTECERERERQRERVSDRRAREKNRRTKLQRFDGSEMRRRRKKQNVSYYIHFPFVFYAICCNPNVVMSFWCDVPRISGQPKYAHCAK